MGVAIHQLIETETITFDNLRGKIVAVDAYNMLYQFLTSIRSYDGKPLMNSKGVVTSHLQGLFTRVCALLEKEVKLVFVFDGKPPALKEQLLEERKGRKLEATAKLEQAKEDKDLQAIQKYARQTVSLNKEMVADAKILLQALGIPVVQAPTEGEAQASYMCIKGDVDCVASQDADVLLFGAPCAVRNLSSAGRRKLPGKQQWVVVNPQRMYLENVLEGLKLSLPQLICLGMLTGTDYAPGGIKGIGPKNALKLVTAKLPTKPTSAELDSFFQDVKWADAHEVAWSSVYELFTDFERTDDYVLEWQPINYEAAQELLIEKYEFSTNRVESTFSKLKKALDKASQKGLSDFF